MADQGGRVAYADWHSGLAGYDSRLRALLDRESPRDVCDVGGGAQPSLSIGEVEDRGLRYTLLDISQSELDKSPDGYAKVCLDICGPLPPELVQRYDVVLSHMLAEHVADPQTFHRNIFSMLRPGGVAVHLMPTYYEPAFIANALLPDFLTEVLVRRAQPTRDFDHSAGKFPAYYRWCRGPSRRHIRRFERLGFQVENMTGYFGTGYLRRLGPVQRLYERVWVAPLVRHPVPWLTSYCWVVLRRPE